MHSANWYWHLIQTRMLAKRSLTSMQDTASNPLVSRPREISAVSSSYFDNKLQGDKATRHKVRTEEAMEGSKLRFQGPSKQVVARLCYSERVSGVRILDKILEACKVLHNDLSTLEAGTTMRAVCQEVLGELQDFHASILNLDEELAEESTGDAGAAEAAVLEDCRRWLQQAQSFVLQLQRQLNSFIQLDVGTERWPRFLKSTVQTLKVVIEQIEGGGTLDGEVVAQVKKRATRQVSTTSHMPYNAYWARKIGI